MALPVLKSLNSDPKEASVPIFLGLTALAMASRGSLTTLGRPRVSTYGMDEESQESDSV